MGTLTEGRLSASDGGRPIGIDRDASPGTLLHTATSEAAGYDKVRLYVCNNDEASHVLFLQWGGVTPTDLLPVMVPAGIGMVLNIPLLYIEGGLEVRAYGDVVDVLNVTGGRLRASAMGEVDFQDRTAP